VRTESWLSRVTSALGALLAIALVTRLAWWLLAPAVPALIVLLGLFGVFQWLLGRR
jgi:hypothetical protein